MKLRCALSLLGSTCMTLTGFFCNFQGRRHVLHQTLQFRVMFLILLLGLRSPFIFSRFGHCTISQWLVNYATLEEIQIAFTLTTSDKWDVDYCPRLRSKVQSVACVSVKRPLWSNVSNHARVSRPPKGILNLK